MQLGQNCGLTLVSPESQQKCEQNIQKFIKMCTPEKLVRRSARAPWYRNAMSVVEMDG